MFTASTRRDLDKFLEDSLNKTYEGLRENQELPRHQPLLKTYIVESNLDSVESWPGADGYNVSLNKSNQDELVTVAFTNARGNQGELYVDVAGKRFLIIHTMTKTEISDPFLDKTIMVPGSKLDFPWLTNHFLESMGDNDEFRGFTVKYANRFQHGDVDTPIDSMSMKLWGSNAPRVLRLLKNEPDLKNSVAISGVGLKRYEDKENFILDDLTYYGKFTARGTSLSTHYSLTNEVVKKYGRLIGHVEDLIVQLSPVTNGYRLDGESLTIHFNRQIVDMPHFVEILLSSRHPFRLWGIHKALNPAYYRINAVDLHTGSKMDLELSREWLRVYLHPGSCGNALLRLCTNIQHYYDSEAVLMVGNNERII